MGIFKKWQDAVQRQSNIVNKSMPKHNNSEVRITFGSDYITELRELAEIAKSGKLGDIRSVEIHFDQDLLEEIDSSIQSHSDVSGRILYSDEIQDLHIVGESFHQEELKSLFNKVQDSWLSGFLMPEPMNPHDPNAVSIMIITDGTDEEDGEPFKVIQAGYLKKEQAQKVSRKLIRLCEQDNYIPVLCKLRGGTADKPTIGLWAGAKTEEIIF